MSQVNIKEVARRLKAAMPDRSVSVDVKYWCYKEGHDEAKFNVSVLPGLDGTDCSITRFSDTEELNKWVDQTIKKHTGE